MNVLDLQAMSAKPEEGAGRLLSLASVACDDSLLSVFFCG